MLSRVASWAVCLAVVAGCAHPTEPPVSVPALQYDSNAGAVPPSYVWNSESDPYVVSFREQYALASVAAGATDLDRVRSVAKWVHSRFAHDGSHAAPIQQPMEILAAAAQGQRFRCVEYSLVTAGVLNSVGIPARVVWLLLKNEATKTDGLAHVVAEAYLRESNSWVMVDAQWDAIPVAGAPLSIVAYQQALANKQPNVSILSRSGLSADAYHRWIGAYLYYFYSPVDTRIGVTRSRDAVLLSPSGDNSLMAKYPSPTRHTHVVDAFYPKP